MPIYIIVDPYRDKLVIYKVIINDTESRIIKSISKVTNIQQRVELIIKQISSNDVTSVYVDAVAYGITIYEKLAIYYQNKDFIKPVFTKWYEILAKLVFQEDEA